MSDSASADNAWQSVVNGNVVGNSVQFDYRGGSAVYVTNVAEGSTVSVSIDNTIANCIGSCTPTPDNWTVSINGQTFSGNAIEIATVSAIVSGQVTISVSGIDNGFWAGWYGPIFTPSVTSAPAPSPTPSSSPTIEPSPTPTPEPSPSPTLTVEPTPSPSPTPEATQQPIPSESPTATATPTQSSIPAPSNRVNGTAGENENLNLVAPMGKIFTSVIFASYGLPENFVINAQCHAVNSIEKVSEIFLGKDNAIIQASNSIFGDPCGGIVKRLQVILEYGDAPTPSPSPTAVEPQPSPQPTPTETATNPQPSATPNVPTPSPTSESTSTATPSPEPSVTPTPQPQPTQGPSPSTPEPTPQPSPTPSPSNEPTPDPVRPEPPVVVPEPTPNPVEPEPTPVEDSQSSTPDDETQQPQPTPDSESETPTETPSQEESSNPDTTDSSTDPAENVDQQPVEEQLPPTEESNSNSPSETPLPPEIESEPTPDATEAEVLAESVGLIPNSPDSLPETEPKLPEPEALKPHIQVDKPGVENGGIEFFGTKSQPQVIGEDGQLTPPPPLPGSGDPIPPDAITTEETFIGQPGGTTFNSPDIAVPVEPIEINIEIPGVGEAAQAMADAYVALANIGNDMSPITRKKAKKILIATLVAGQISQLRRRF